VLPKVHCRVSCVVRVFSTAGSSSPEQPRVQAAAQVLAPALDRSAQRSSRRRGAAGSGGDSVAPAACPDGERSGRPDSNQRPPRPKRGALARLSYAPTPLECPNRMAVRADELTLEYLSHDQTTAMPFYQSAHVSEFCRAWQVVPGHRSMVKILAAVGTWCVRPRRWNASSGLLSPHFPHLFIERR
jgi:hypothetical protein